MGADYQLYFSHCVLVQKDRGSGSERSEDPDPVFLDPDSDPDPVFSWIRPSLEKTVLKVGYPYHLWTIHHGNNPSGKAS